MTLTHMTMAIAVVFLSKSSLTCGNRQVSEKLTAISLIQKTPLVNRDKSISIMENYYNVYYYEDLVMYKFMYRFDSVSNNELMLQDVRFFFFVFHKDSSSGHIYYIKSDPLVNYNRRVNKDSLLKRNLFEANVYDSLADLKPDSIYQHKDEIIRVYKNPPSASSAQQTEKYDLYFHYTRKLKDVPETFSRKMDNIKRMKLSKILIKVSGGFNNQFNTTFPPRELLEQMTELEIDDENEIMNYFKDYLAQGKAEFKN